MTLPTSGAIGLTDVMNELRVSNPGRAYPIGLGDADVLALAGKSAPPLSLSDLYGKSSQLPLTATATGQDNSYSSVTAGGNATASGTVTPAGGSGGYTYAWTVVSNTGSATVGALNGASVGISKTFSKNTDGSARVVFNVTVTDSQGHTATVSNVAVTVEWFSNL